MPKTLCQHPCLQEEYIFIFVSTYRHSQNSLSTPLFTLRSDTNFLEFQQIAFGFRLEDPFRAFFIDSPRRPEQCAGVFVIRVVRSFSAPVGNGLTTHAAHLRNAYLCLLFQNHSQQANSGPPAETFCQRIPFSNFRQVPAKALSGGCL